MLRLPPFELLQPATLAEALELKKQHGEDAMYTSGGTDLYPNMKRRQFEPQFLIALKGIEELSRIEIKNGIRIGAGVSLDNVANHPFIQEHYTALSTAAGLVSSPQLRKMGTLGGNLCVDTRCTYYNQNYPWRKSEHSEIRTLLGFPWIQVFPPESVQETRFQALWQDRSWKPFWFSTGSNL